MKRLAVVILNYKTPHLVIDCLQSLVDQIDPQQDCVVVVDSCSPDNSAEIIQSALTDHNWTWCQLVQPPGNNGFSAGNNFGMQTVEAEAYLLLNSDTIVRPNAIAHLLDAFATHPQAGIISPRLEWPDATPQISCFRNISPASQIINAAQTGPITKLLKRFDVPIDVSETPMQPDWTSFAAVMLRGETVRQIGWMDDGYFMYFEDNDYCRRARQAGWQIQHWPAAHIVHLRGGSSNVKAATIARTRRPSYWYAARSRYLAKFYKGRLGLWFANLCWIFGRTIALLRELVGNKAPHHCEYEGRDNWTNWRNPVKNS
ncbi:MAG: glycosyltransferase family 2 protein [Candidatus Promineifilaceae bacterium]